MAARCPCCGEFSKYAGVAIWCHNSGWLDQNTTTTTQTQEER